MGPAHGRKRDVVVLGTILACMLLAGRSPAFALNPVMDVSQYAHKVWKVGEGFSKGAIHAIAQTPDGYLWLGTDFGLYRFDGVNNIPWQFPPGQQLPSNQIRTLIAARDGTLWIGASRGLASWKEGKLTRYAQLSGQGILGLYEDREGVVWAGGNSAPNGGITCAIQNSSARCSGGDGRFSEGIAGFREDAKGNLWAEAPNGLWRWKPGLPGADNGEILIPMHAENRPGSGLLRGADNGEILIALHGAIARLVDGKTQELYTLPAAFRRLPIRRLFRDRNGGLWVGTQGGGLVHIHRGRTDAFAQSDGLTGDDISDIFEDREGNVWVSTLNGLDQFRDYTVATFTADQGLSSARVVSVLAARDGSIWLRTLDGLNRWNNGQVTIYRERNSELAQAALQRAPGQEPAHVLTGSGLPEQGVGSLYQDDHGRIWVATLRGVGYLENERFIFIRGIPGGRVHSIEGDKEENLWIAHEDSGLFRLLPDGAVQQFSWPQLGHKDFAFALAVDPAADGLWLGFYRGGVVYFKDGQARKSYAAADGLGEGRVNSLRFDRDGALWAATEGGLSRLKNGRLATLTGKNGLPCDAIHWTIEDDAGSMWLYTACGLLRMARSEVDAWAAAADQGNDAKRMIQVTLFDSSDGVRTRANAGGFSPHVGKSPDGKLWFFPLDGLSVFDPNHLPFNKIPPPVQIEQTTADRKTHDVPSDVHGHQRLPPLTRDLEIDYTALSLVAPEKVFFRVKLEGRDPDWKDMGTERKAFYNDLPPRNYRFRVKACNNSGVWNEAGASFDFSIDPAYYQTAWFKASCVAAFLGSFWALYRYRLHQIAREFNARLEERVAERTRIARELHDTLLQSFQGLMLRFQVAHDELPGRPAEARRTLEKALDQAAQAITEGRDAVQGLRSSTVETNDLARAIGALGEELAGDGSNSNRVESFVDVEGTPRDVHPVLRDEIYRIAGEALRNAFRHAQARRIEVSIWYGERQFRLRVRDDGKGIDPEVLDEQGRAGHWGLAGMRERAELIGGQLEIWSQQESGTQVELSIPASLAYGTSPARGFRLFAKKARTNA
jgi:signal transduction histidine kinase/ligand-binding sensor domain-containing protein